MRNLIIILGMLLGLLAPAYAVETLTPQPMRLTAASASNDSAPYQVPMIVWGADVPTVFANGNKALTKPGSLFAQKGLKIKLFREDRFARQVEKFRRGEINFLRGTLGMILSASEALCDDPRTCPQIVYVLSRSTGGDALVVRKGIKTLKDLKGKTIGLQLYGPHMRLLVETLKLAGLSVSDVQVKWYRDLDVNGDASPYHAFAAGEVDAAFVISPDAAALTSGDTAVAGARVLFSTKSLSSVIFDVYAVRPDFAKTYEKELHAFVSALLQANEKARKVLKTGGSEADELLSVAAGMLLGAPNDPQAKDDIKAMYQLDASMMGWTGNVRFLSCQADGQKELVCLKTALQDAAQAFQQLGLIQDPSVARKIVPVPLDWEKLKAGLSERFGTVAVALNPEAVSAVVGKKIASGTLENDVLVRFSIYFKPNQMDFPAELYATEFDRVLEALATAGGAVVLIEGHSDPLLYLKQKYSKKYKKPASVWRKTAQAAKNLSRRRAEAVLAALKAYAKEKGVRVSFAGATVVGYGISKPANGICVWTLDGVQMKDPCRPKSKQEWAANRRVTFSIVSVEGESEAFNPSDF